MRARDLMEDHTMVDPDTDPLEATRLMAERGLPGIVVRGDAKRPFTVLPASQVLRFVIPAYVQENPALARVYDENAADHIADALAGRTVADVLPSTRDRTAVPRVNVDDTLLEVAAVMARCHSPIVVVGRGEEIVGVVTIRRLLAALVPTDSSPGGAAGSAGDTTANPPPTAGPAA